MDKNGKRLILIITLTLLVILLAYYYVFNIYETTIETEPGNLFADSKSVVNISVQPVNAFGFKVPFRTIPANFEITEVKDLVDIVKYDDKNGRLVLRAKDRAGKVAVSIKSRYSFLPTLVEVNIYPNTA